MNSDNYVYDGAQVLETQRRGPPLTCESDTGGGGGRHGFGSTCEGEEYLESGQRGTPPLGVLRKTKHEKNELDTTWQHRH